MFGISWPELLLVVVIAVFVIGPKDIPNILYQVGRFFRRIQYMKFAMSQQFDDLLKSGDIEELRKSVNFEAPKTDEKMADDMSPLTSPRERGEKSKADEGGEKLS